MEIDDEEPFSFLTMDSTSERVNKVTGSRTTSPERLADGRAIIISRSGFPRRLAIS